MSEVHTITTKTEVINLGTIGTVRVRRPSINRLRLRRRMLTGIARAFQDVLTRTDVYGLENIPNSPVIILPNHLSNLDSIMVLAYFPRQAEMVGPGDFKMITIKDWVIKGYGVTEINRGRGDSGSLKRMISHLRGGKDMLMFPTGGMWEKREMIAKDGAVYLSQLTQTPILPVGISGAYLKSMDAFTGRRPKLTIRFGEVMPPVAPSKNRRERDADLEAAGKDIMSHIWDLLEPSEQALYTGWFNEVCHMDIAFVDASTGEPVPYTGPTMPDMALLAEFVNKPNLFRPMWENAGLLLDPFMKDGFFGPVEVQMAARDLRDLLTNEYDRYIPYRMGEEAQEPVIDALQALAEDVSEWAMHNNALINLTPVSTMPRNI